MPRSPSRSMPANSRPRRRARALTLAELTVSLSLSGIVLAGVASTVLLASRTLPDSGVGARERRLGVAASEALERISAELTYATEIGELTATSIEFAVADRGHGGSGDETIRYSWSGVSGAPLLRAYNGSSPVALVDAVSSFQISAREGAGTLRSTPRVLFIVKDAVGLLGIVDSLGGLLGGLLGNSDDDAAKYALLDSWGFSIALAGEADSLAAIQALARNCDVILISEEVNGTTFSSKAYNSARGVVLEENQVATAFGVTWFVLGLTQKQSKVMIAEHPILAGWDVDDSIDLCTSNQTLTATVLSDLAPGAITLTETSNAPACVALEHGAALISGGTARARRVLLPWGGSSLSNFEYDTLTDDAKTLLRRALVWAAAPTVYSGAQISLTVAGDAALTTEAPLLNRPKVNAP